MDGGSVERRRKRRSGHGSEVAALTIPLPLHRVSRPLHLCSGMAALQLPSRL